MYVGKGYRFQIRLNKWYVYSIMINLESGSENAVRGKVCLLG